MNPEKPLQQWSGFFLFDRRMRIVFLGTPDFAVETLRVLHENFIVAGVVTAADKPAGRGQQVQESAVKKFAVAHSIPVLQPLNLKDAAFAEELKKLKADVQVVVAFRMLPEQIWNMPALGTYNLHASLLPRYRGAAPINWAIINGETETGVSTFKLKHEIDSGNILLQQRVEIGADTTAGELHDELMRVGALLMLKSMIQLEDAWKNNRILEFKTQDERHITHAPKIFKETCRINWAQSGKQIRDHIRGLSPYPGAFGVLTDPEGKNKTLKIYKTDFIKEEVKGTNGLLHTDGKNFIRVKCADGWLNLLELQLEGKKRMPVQELLRGLRLSGDWKLE